MKEDKKILVTGASGGIGRAIALDCAKAGYYVICHYNHGKEKAESLLKEIKEKGGNGELIQFDITDRNDCRTKLEALTEVHGALWGIINNAGITKDNTFAGLSGDDWDSVVHTNLDSFYNVLNPLVMPLARKKKCRIITIASVSGMLSENKVNIEDISQTIIGDYFTMIMLVSLDKADIKFADLVKKAETLGKEAGVEIHVQNEEIFNAIHKI